MIGIQMQYGHREEEGRQPNRWNPARSPVGSPKNSYSRQQFGSLGFTTGSKYPLSQKYPPPTPAPRPLYPSPPHQSYPVYSAPPKDPYPSDSADLRLTISQLRSSLQSSNDSVQRLQQQLSGERRRVYELGEVKRRLQEELQRAQFQLERMGSYESLQGRQAEVKLETALRDNARLGQQVSDLMDENKRMRGEQRRLMSEVEGLMAERSALAGENAELERRLGGLEREMRGVREELERGSRVSLQGNPSWQGQGLLQGPTQRSQHQPTVVPSAQSIRLPSLAEQNQAEEEKGAKMLRDYQKLLVENQSMKRLYQQFYKNGQAQASLLREQARPPLPQDKQYTQYVQNQEELPRSFSNHRIAQRLSSSRDNDYPPLQTEFYQTAQRDQLRGQLSSVRSQALEEVQRCYARSIAQADSQKKNALRVFAQQLGKNMSVFAKLAENYLEMREAVKEEVGVRLPEGVGKMEGEGAMVGQMYQSVKDKAKGEGSAGLSVAVFRLLTLLSRCKSLPVALQQNIQHSTLKYLYKLGNPSVHLGA